MRRIALAITLLGALAAAAAERGQSAELLGESEYRAGLEEVIVRGQAPLWRDREPRPDLRPGEVEFFGREETSRMQWFPPYERQEREKYQKVRDRKNETPELKLFEIRF